MEWEPRDRMELNEQKKEYSAVTRNCFEWVEAVVTSIVVVVLLFTFLFRVVNVNGQSMEDTIHNEDKVLLTNLFYEPENGDVVVISRAQHFEGDRHRGTDPENRLQYRRCLCRRGFARRALY